MSALDYMPEAKPIDQHKLARELASDMARKAARSQAQVPVPPIRHGKYTITPPKQVEQWDMSVNVDVVKYCERLGISYEWAFARFENGQFVKDWHRAGCRHRVWNEMRKDGITYPAIGLACGTDHTTIMYGVKRYKECVCKGT